MILLTGITDQAKQQMSLVLADGSKADLLMEFRPQQSGWFYNLSYNDFVVTGQRVVTSPNMVRQFRNLIPFGLAVLVIDFAEPTAQTDWQDGTATMYLLNAAEVLEVEAQVYPGT